MCHNRHHGLIEGGRSGGKLGAFWHFVQLNLAPSDHGLFWEVPEGYCHNRWYGRWHGRCIVVCEIRCFKLTGTVLHVNPTQLSSCSVTNCSLASCVFRSLLFDSYHTVSGDCRPDSITGNTACRGTSNAGPQLLWPGEVWSKGKSTCTDSQAWSIQKWSKKMVKDDFISMQFQHPKLQESGKLKYVKTVLEHVMWVSSPPDQPRQFASSHLDGIWRESDEMMCEQLTFADKTKREEVHIR